jgi:hypothetical protein
MGMGAREPEERFIPLSPTCILPHNKHNKKDASKGVPQALSTLTLASPLLRVEGIIWLCP